MIGDYLNQTAIWKRVVSSGGYPPTPEPTGTEIRVRWEARRRLVRDATGREVASEGTVYCREAIEPGDVLEYQDRAWTVIAVSEVVDLDGRAVYREAAV